jgi:hypothetical protein
MSETTTTVGAYLRSERERRGISLKTISDQTKVSVPLLEGLEADDLSRWPGGIFRRAFVRGYATCIGLEPDDVVKRFEEQHRPQQPDEAGPVELPPAVAAPALAAPPSEANVIPIRRPWVGARARSRRRVRLLGTSADLTVAVVLGLASAAAGSRMLWPVLLIAAYYALGSVLTGTTPMLALLCDEGDLDGVKREARPESLSMGSSRKKARHEHAGREPRRDGAGRRPHGRVTAGAQ